jgi:hypothetical protein
MTTVNCRNSFLTICLLLAAFMPVADAQQSANAYIQEFGKAGALAR